MKPESENNPEGRYILKLDMRRYFPGGQIPEQLLEAAKCHLRAEVWASYLECDVKAIEEQARQMAENTTISYREAIDKVSRDIMNNKTKTERNPLSRPYKPARPNRAQRRKAQKERRRKHGKRK